MTVDLVCATGRDSDELAAVYGPCDEPPRWRFRAKTDDKDESAWAFCCTLHRAWLPLTRYDIERIAVNL